MNLVASQNKKIKKLKAAKIVVIQKDILEDLYNIDSQLL